MDSVPTVEDAVSLYQSLSDAWKSAGMYARKWLSNSAALLEKVSEVDRAAKIDLSNDNLPTTKTLGVLWSAEDDVFSFSLSPPPDDMPITKRNILKKVAKIFDPLGFLAPVVVRAKMILQLMWTSGVQWDEVAPPDLESKTRRWFQELEDLAAISIPRCLQSLTTQPQHVQLHVFLDASEDAYGAVIYQKSRYEFDEPMVQFVTAKSRVAPVTATSIPRLELMAAVLGTQLAVSSASALSIKMESVWFWSDSMDVLWWIRGKSRNFKTFVANRVGYIQQNSNPQQWRHVPTACNPADIVSRGCASADLQANSMWWHGPGFLLQTEDQWPASSFSAPTEPKEVKKSGRHEAPVHVFAADVPTDTTSWRLQPERYSDWQQLVRTQAWVMRFVNNCRVPANRRVLKRLSTDEVRDAETQIVKQAQQEEFQEDIRALSRGDTVRDSSKLLPLHPMLDEDGLQHAEFLPWSTVYPIILPRKHHVTKLIIKQVHDNGSHMLGVNQVLSQLSTNYWIPAGREAVKEVEKSCNQCQRRKAKPAKQLMGALPANRLRPSFQAFTQVGLDFAGPFTTIQGRGKTRAKRWLAVVTCLTTRAVHLELAFGLDTSSFLNCFYRMVGRRGVPREVVSDNGTNFVGAVREL